VLLVLLDVDGTLLLAHDPLVARSALDAAREAYGVELADDAFDRTDHAGRTALAIGRMLLRSAGLEDGEIEPRLGSWCALHARRYLELLADADTSGWRTSPGTREALEALAPSARLALLTGNPEPVARARMERLGLARFFPAGQGAFGCESESRPDLIRRARERAGTQGRPWPSEATVAVGDTRVDVDAARAAGVMVVAVAPAGESAPAGADARISSLRSLPAALAALSR
jgi:phosphoglycolate phosphatase-like HAD superfamily hydrolase